MIKESGSSLGTFMNCPKLYEYKYVKLLEGSNYSSALGFGTFVHSILEHSHAGKEMDIDKIVNPFKEQHPESIDEIMNDWELARGVAFSQIAYWSQSDISMAKLDFIDVEAEWEFRLPRMDDRDPFSHVGKRDGYVKMDDKYFLYELKTAAKISKENYVTRLELDKQINSNIIALREEGKKCHGVIYDIIWKPAIRLRKNETDDDFIKRKIDCYNDDPKEYFDRKLIFRNDVDLTDYHFELEQQFQALNNATTNDAFYRNSGNCMKYNSLCQFFHTCMDPRNKDMEKTFKQKTRKHMELESK